jgi:hypothetical protein
MTDEQENEPIEQEEVQAEEKKSKEYNWAQANKLIKAQAEELAALRAQKATVPNQQVSNESAPSNLQDEDWLTVGQYKKMSTSELKSMVEEEVTRRTERATFQQAKAQATDWESVLTRESIAEFERDNPAYAASLAKITDQDAQTIAVYHAIKAYKGQKAPATSREQAINREKIDRNLEKPHTTALPKPPDARPQAEDPYDQRLRRKQLWTKMQNLARQA